MAISKLKKPKNWDKLILERLLEVKNVLSNLASAPEFTDASEWNVIDNCVSILKRMDQLTIKLSGEKYITMSSVIPLVRGLQLKQINCFEKFGDSRIQKTVFKSTFLDLRYRNGLVENVKNCYR